MAHWSLRTRLTAIIVALIAVVCVGAGIGTELALRNFLMAQLDSQVARAGTGVVRFQVDGPEAPPDAGRTDLRLTGGPGQDTVVAFVSNGSVSQAQVYRGPDRTEALTVEEATTLAGIPGDGHPVTVDLGDELGSYRAVGYTTPDDSTVVVTGLPQGPVNDTLLRVLLIELIIATAAVLIGGTVAALIVRRTLTPLRRVAATATRVAELPLDRGEVALSVRVPSPDTDPRTEVGQVGSAINRMLGHVANALNARHASEQRVRQFVADASHELRTPLAAIRGYAELTRRGGHELPADVTHAIGRVESESRRMTTLVDDLLLLARLDSGRPLGRTEVDLSRVVADAVSDAHVAGPDHTWRLDLPPEPVTVPGDDARLHQVVANLLGNARTHTPPGTTVVTRLRNARGSVTLTVTDDGPGIPADILPNIFERFARGDSSRSRAAGSTGLGLAIVHAVVTAHHGTVTATSPPTTFTITLPTTPAVPPRDDSALEGSAPER
nr:HAMP domain-containing sensor histidine kinase [Actinocatenispora rupis]